MLRRSIGARLAVAYVVPTLIGLIALGTWVERLVSRALEDELGRKMVAVASAAAAAIPADRLPYLQPGDEKTRTYRNFLDRLEELRAATGVRRLSVFGPDEKVIVDAGGAAAIGDPLPEVARDRLELSHVLQGTAEASQVLFELEGRFYKAGYAPVRDQGRVVGAVLAEGSSEYFDGLRRLRASLFLAGLLAALATAALALLFSRTLGAPIRRLVNAARRIGEGDLRTPVPPAGTDELGYLAGTLEEMRERLLERDSELQMMLAGIAHEVRNPLGGMDLYSGLLLEELEGDERAGTVRKIRREIGQLTRIVEEFLDYARERPLALERTSARSLLEEAASLASADARDKEVRIAVEAGVYPLVCDTGLVHRALLNLLKNAIDFSPRGGVVRLSGRQEGGRVVLEVADQGPGVAAGDGERIFAPFFTTREKGTGLGLAFVRKIAEAHGGEVSLAPSAAGATFALILPAAAPVAVDAPGARAG